MAAFALAHCYETGTGVQQNKATAYSMYHALTHRDGRTFLTRRPKPGEIDQIRHRMAALRAQATTVEREGSRLRMVWGEDEIIITETAEPSRRKKRA